MIIIGELINVDEWIATHQYTWNGWLKKAAAVDH